MRQKLTEKTTTSIPYPLPMRSEDRFRQYNTFSPELEEQNKWYLPQGNRIKTVTTNINYFPMIPVTIVK